MPRLDGAQESLYHGSQDAAHRVATAWEGFTDWVFSDNVLEVAIGLIIAAAFTAVVTSFTSDIILPIVSLLPFLSKNFDEKFAILKGPRHSKGVHYNTIKQALDDGAVVLAYGTFINKIINFFVIGLALYTLASVYGWASGDKIIKRTVKCKYCRKRISSKAHRCFNCTSWQDGRED